MLTSLGKSLFSSTTKLGFVQNHCKPFHIIITTRPFSLSSEERAIRESFTVTYLINSCGLSPETAKSVSKKLKKAHLETSKKPDSVISLLRNHGLTDTHISKLVSRRPTLLLSSPENTLLPKLEFFHSVGITSADLAKILSSNPCILQASLENNIIPGYNFLKSLLVLDEKVVTALNRLRFITDVQKFAALNVSLLRGLGVQQSAISILVYNNPNVVCRNADNFDEDVNRLIKMGYNPLTKIFLAALRVISEMNKSTWEHKMEVYRRWGWLEDEILLAFRKQPYCMKCSGKKITSVMDFLVNKMGWQSAAVARIPTVFTCSLEKRIIPRCSVVKILQLKGLVKEEVHLSTLLVTSEKYFLDTFVTKYEEHVPQLLDVFRGKIGLLELGLTFEEMFGMKRL